MERTINRRDILTGSAALPVLAIAASRVNAESPYDQIRHHISEIKRLLSETRPKEFKATRDFCVIGNLMTAQAFPAGYKFGMEYAHLDPLTGRWARAV